MSEYGWPGWPDDDPADAQRRGDTPTPDPLDEPADPRHSGLDHVAWDDEDRHGPDTVDPGTAAHDEPDAGHPSGLAPPALSDTHDTVEPAEAGADEAGAAQHGGWPEHPTGYGMGAVGTDPDAVGDGAGQGDVFPPAVDVGPLPEPVDGFPWIDTGSLGVVPADAWADQPPTGRPDSAELAGYAASELPAGVDPWAHLAASDDPATSALARFWHQPDDGPDAGEPR